MMFFAILDRADSYIGKIWISMCIIYEYYIFLLMHSYNNFLKINITIIWNWILSVDTGQIHNAQNVAQKFKISFGVSYTP